MDDYTCLFGDDYKKSCPTKKDKPCSECGYKDKKIIIPEKKIFDSINAPSNEIKVLKNNGRIIGLVNIKLKV